MQKDNRRPEHKYSDFFEKYDPANQNKKTPYVRKKQVSVNYDRYRKKPNVPIKKSNFLKTICILIVIGIVICTISFVFNESGNAAPTIDNSVVITTTATTTKPFVPKQKQIPQNLINLGDEINSKYAILVDITNQKVLAGKNQSSIIAPASMAKVMTLLVAAEKLESRMSDHFVMTYELLNPLYNSDATLAGFQEGEQVQIYDLFYASAMVSAADATMALAIAAGSCEKDFVEMMNKKAKQLGLSHTHFSNPIGLDDCKLFTTPYEMALIFEAALNNDFCKTIMSTEDYTIEKNDFHTEGIKLKNSMFEKMFGTEPIVATIKGGKTGFTANAGYCLVSYAKATDNRELICVTAKGDGKYQPVYDAFKIYRDYCGLPVPSTTSA